MLKRKKAAPCSFVNEKPKYNTQKKMKFFVRDIFIRSICVYARLFSVIFTVDYVRVRSGRMLVDFHAVLYTIGHKTDADCKEI